MSSSSPNQDDTPECTISRYRRLLLSLIMLLLPLLNILTPPPLLRNNNTRDMVRSSRMQHQGHILRLDILVISSRHQGMRLWLQGQAQDRTPGCPVMRRWWRGITRCRRKIDVVELCGKVDEERMGEEQGKLTQMRLKISRVG